MPHRSLSRAHSLAIAAGATYGPFAIMTLYTQFFISCQHCKEATLQLLPGGPGVLGSIWFVHLTGMPRLPDLAELAAAMVTSALFVGFIALFGRLGRSWLIGAALLACLCCSFEAFVLLAFIRM